MQYSFQFDEALQQEWVWTERYASQPEILSYIEHVAERYDLKRDIRLDTRVIAASFDEVADQWVVQTAAGESISARFFIMAVGCLSSAISPRFPGHDDFKGSVYHTGLWPHRKVNFTNKRVGIIGTGSSGVQSIPLIAEEAAHLYVFQRTANYVVPAQNHRLSTEETATLKNRTLRLRVHRGYWSTRAVTSSQSMAAFCFILSNALAIGM